MTGIIDMHTHMFPEDVIHNWNKYAERDHLELLSTTKKKEIKNQISYLNLSDF